MKHVIQHPMANVDGAEVLRFLRSDACQIWDIPILHVHVLVFE